MSEHVDGGGGRIPDGFLEPPPVTFESSQAATQAGHPTWTVPAFSTVFELDQLGTFLLGLNRLLLRRVGNLLGNGWLPTGFMWQPASLTTFLGAHATLVGVGDPVDFLTVRAGPDNSGPDNGGVGIAGVTAGSSLGAWRAQGAATPVGGTPDVTLGAVFQGDSAMITPFASEDNRDMGNGVYHQGGGWRHYTTPNGTHTPILALTIDQDQKVLAQAGIGVGNSASGSSLGSVVKKIEVFDKNGASLGFLPVYNQIT